MKPDCVKALTAAAGRTLTKGELDGIESRTLSALKEMSAEDPDGFREMSLPERMKEAAKIAKDKMLSDMVDAHERSIQEATRKAALRSTLDAVRPGKNGQMQALRDIVADPFHGLETKVDGISTNFTRQLDGLHDAVGGKFFNLFHDPEKQLDVVKAIYGEQASPEATRLAASVKKVTDALAARTKSAGIPLNPLEDYRVPQPLEPSRVGAVSKEEFVQDALAHTDLNRFVKSDGSRMNQTEIEKLLGDSHLTIMTDGANRRAEGEMQGRSALVGQNKNAPRQFFYKNADSWSYMVNKYGRSTNMYDLLGAHIRGLSRDIAMAETFGRNADANFSQALDRAFTNDLQAIDPTGHNAARSARNHIQRIYDATAHPIRVGNETAANIAAQARGVIASSQLGSLVGAFADTVGMKMASNLNGLPPLQTFRGFVENLLPSKERTEFLHNTGVWMEGFQNAANRTGVEALRGGIGTFLNELTHRMMGLHGFDRGLRSGNGLVVMRQLGKLTRDSDLATAAGETGIIRKAGVQQSHWDTWKQAELDSSPGGGYKLLTPDSIYRIPDADLQSIVEQQMAARSEAFQKELAKRDAQITRMGDNPDAARVQDIRDAFQTKFDGLLKDETQKLKDESAEKLLALTSAQMQFGGRGASMSSAADKVAFGLDRHAPGTLDGELWRFAMQFKSVPLGIFRAHWTAMQDLPNMSLTNIMGSKQAYAAKFMAYSTLVGALITQLKSLINGQNPHTMNPDTPEGKKFWAEAGLSGGGFGLYGDLFLNGQTAMGSGAETLAGPGVSAGWDLLKEARTALGEAQTGEFKHPYALGGVRWVRRNATPLANLWYTKAAFNRLVYDQLQDKLAPGSSAKQQRRMEQRGNSYYWRPGTTAPQSAPDLSKALE